MLAHGTTGNSEASTTRSPDTPRTRPGGVGHRHRVVRRRPCGRSRRHATPRSPPADEASSSSSSRHHFVETEALDDIAVDQPAAQRRRPVEQLGDDARRDAVLGVDHADAAHPVAVAGRERIGWSPPRKAALVCSAPRRRNPSISRSTSRLSDSRLNSTHRFGVRIGGGKPHPAGLGVGLVDEQHQRGDLLAHRMPGRLAGAGDEHVPRRRAWQSGRIAHRQHGCAAACARPSAPAGLMNEASAIDGWSISRCADAGQVGAHLDAQRAQCRRPGRSRRAADAPACGWRRCTG